MEELRSIVLWNFSILSKLQPSDTLMVSDGRLFLDQRYLRSVRRYFSNDSRGKVLDTIRFNVRLVRDLNHPDLSDAMEDARKGLSVMADSGPYCNDLNFGLELQLLSHQMKTASPP